MGNKKGQGNVFVWVLVILGVFLLFRSGALGGLGLGGATTTVTAPATTPTVNTPIGAICPGISSVTGIIGSTTTWKAPGTSTSGTYHRIFRGKLDQGLKAEGSTISFGPGEKVTAYYADNSTTYYSAKVGEFSVPCEAFQVSQFDGGRNQLYRNGSLTIDVFNDDDGDLNAQTNNETIDANEAIDWTINLKGQSDRGVSPYGFIKAVVDLNGSLAFDGTKTNMVNWERVSNPTTTLVSPQFAVSDVKTFRIAGGPTSGNQYILNGATLHVEGGTANPNAGGTGAEVVRVLWLGEDYCLSADVSDKELDPPVSEDEDGNALVAGTTTCGANHLRQSTSIYYN